MQDSPTSSHAGQPAPLELPWSSLRQGRKLFLLSTRPGGRSQSLGRFLGASFLAFGLLLLLVGTQQSLPPALAGGGASLVAGLGLLAATRSGRAPLLVLDAESGHALLCRRHLGRLAFRRFPLQGLAITADAVAGRVRIHPGANAGAGQEIPGYLSRISDREWREGMALPVAPADAEPAAHALVLWRELALEGETPEVGGALEADDFAALLGKGLPPQLLQDLGSAASVEFQDAREADDPDASPQRPAHMPAGPRPEICRAPDLRDASDRRDKRE
ncbi:MAG: hypothetical protein K2G99_06050 [Desulfovibrio sp.]|nr:hypothetical protein [Desulfovibrio sp.]